MKKRVTVFLDPSSLIVAVAQPDKKCANRTVLCWSGRYDSGVDGVDGVAQPDKKCANGTVLCWSGRYDSGVDGMKPQRILAHTKQ